MLNDSISGELRYIREAGSGMAHLLTTGLDLKSGV
jgi:hypothetical protein